MKGISFSGLSLLCRVKTHDDHHEFDRLVARWEKPIRRLCARMTGDIHRGEDLKQETFVRLFEKPKPNELHVPVQPESRSTMLTIRAKKADVDSFAKDKLSLDEFRKKAKVMPYPGAVDSPRTAPFGGGVTFGSGVAGGGGGGGFGANPGY